MIFVGTSAWFALSVSSDVNYPAARAFLASRSMRLVTTDYVLDEILTLLKARGFPGKALKLGEQIMSESAAQLYRITPDDFADAWNVFQRFSDKGWSFTDCTSKVVIERLGIEDAFVFDHHFEQFGRLRALPGKPA